MLRQDSDLKSLDDFKNHLANLFERFECRDWPPIPIGEKYGRGTFGIVIKFDKMPRRDSGYRDVLVPSCNESIVRDRHNEGPIASEQAKVWMTRSSQCEVRQGSYVLTPLKIKC